MIYVDAPYQSIEGNNAALARFGQPAGAHLRIGVINLMPDKARNECAWLCALADVMGDVLVTFLRLEGQKPTSKEYGEYVAEHYREATRSQLDQCDLLILTGVPVGHLDDPFGEYRYWVLLCRLFDDARSSGIPILGSCWGGNALLKHRHGVGTEKFGRKRLGLFRQSHLSVPPTLTMTNHLPDVMAVTRRLNIPIDAMPKDGSVMLLWGSSETGVFLALDHESHDLFVLNHVEYDHDQLMSEYRRDIGNGVDIVNGDVPVTAPEVPQLATVWQIAGRRLLRDWICWHCDGST